MKNLKFVVFGLAFLTGMILSSCSKNESEDNPTNTEQKTNDQGGGDQGGGGGQGNPTYASFSGVVTDGYSALRGVKVTSGSTTTTTDANGIYTLNQVNVVNGRAVLHFSKEGYMDVVRSIPNAEAARLNVVMRSYNTNTVSATSTASISAYDAGVSVKVDLPGSYVDKNGNTYTGQVKAKSVYLNPDNTDTFAESMPGDLSAVDNQSQQVQLISWGMVAVDLEGEDGQKLQLAEGKKATLKFPVPTKFAGQTPPAKIPLWSFNETTGLWEQEGEATYDSSLLMYVGTVTHFSWHNLDWPEYRATLKIQVNNNQGKGLPYVMVDVDGERTVFTNASGVATCTVPCNTKLKVRIPSSEYGNYTPELQQDNIQLSAGEEKTITFTLPHLPVITGKVINQGTGLKICMLEIIYGDNQHTKGVMSDLFGAFSMRLPADYTGPAVLQATTAEGKVVQKNFTVTGQDQNIDITINTGGNDGGAGTLELTNESGAKTTLSIPGVAADDYFSGASLIGDRLEVNIGEGKHQGGMDEKGWVMFGFTIDGYKANVTTYDSVHVNYMNEGGSVWMSIEMMGKVEVTLNNGKLTYKFTGDGQLNDGNWEEGPKLVKVTANGSTPLFLRAHVVANSTTSFLPSFAPSIAGKAFNGMIIDECSALGKGGIICYTDTTLKEKDYNALIDVAKKAFGQPYSERKLDPNYSAEYQTLSARFFKDDKFLEVSYRPGFKGSENQREVFFYPYELTSTPSRGRINIRAFDKIQVPLTSMGY